MKRQIRNNVFETNSSSTHAICISNDNDYKKRDYIEFEIGEFGWEFERYDSIYSKASYLITAIYENNKDFADEKILQLKEILERNNIDYKLPSPKVKPWEYDGEIKYYYDIDGYIDHAAETEKFVNAVLSDDDAFMRYIFGDSFIVTGNDNDDSYSEYMYECLGEEDTRWGTYKNYGELKKEFDNYDIYKKGN